jgi:flagellar biogenesis protein FliO
MKHLNFRAARTIVTAMTLFATSLTASVCSADEAPAATATATATAATPATKPAAAPTTATTAAATAIAPAAPIAAAPIATAPTATPLQLRETHPLELAQDPASNYAAWKLVGALAAMAAGAFAFKKYNEKNRPAETIRSLKVLKKLSIGVRTELIVVDVDGQRLLLGVTPSSIVTLASLPDPEPIDQPEEVEAPEQTGSRFVPTYRPAEIGERSQQLGERLAALVNRSRVESEKPAELRPDLRVTARPQRRATTKKPSVAPASGAEAVEGQARGLGKIGRL